MKKIWLIAVVIMLQTFSSINAFCTNIDLRQYIPDSEKITAQAETEKYYWIGTEHGLYFVKKKSNRVYHMTSKNSVLLSDTVTCIAAKQDGEVYVGTRCGIVRYDNYAFLLVTRENSPLGCNRITSLVCPNGTDVFAGTVSGGLTVFSRLKARTFTTANAPLPSNHIIAIKKAGDDSVVALLENNISVGIKNGQFTVIAGLYK
jgi:ligand-binding sensor domain-containing protein